MAYPKFMPALRTAERGLQEKCNRPEIGESCRSACIIGGMQVIADILSSHGYKTLTRGGPPQMGIIVSPMEDCPKGFEEIIISTPKNKKVKLCRLGPDVRKKWAPKGKPLTPGATKGALRRKHRKYARGVVTRPIREYD